ncbi:MAG TPA: DUF4249 domain-containing protein [Puia sp.]
MPRPGRHPPKTKLLVTRTYHIGISAIHPARTFRRLAILLGFIAGIPWLACRKDYTPPVLRTNPNLLVVEGVLNAGTGASSTFTLTRTQTIGDSLGAYTPETGARLTILSSNGDIYQLREQGNGIYTSLSLLLDKTEKYQLKIVTHDGSQYLSDAVPVTTAPPIDSLTWQQDQSSGNVTVSINTHDPANNSHYYRWFFTETWEYQSALISELIVQNGLLIFTDSSNQTSTCWRTDSSTDILLGNSTALSQDRINQAPIATIPRAAEKLSVRYSLLASQYILTEQAYRYWSILQKNTQNLGSLFDPQPSQLIGNYHNLTNPNEPVIGYLSASTIGQQRLFIQRNQVGNWDTTGMTCPLRNIPQNPFNFQLYSYSDPSYGPYYFTTFPTGLEISFETCLDCRLKGGSTQKPDFW